MARKLRRIRRHIWLAAGVALLLVPLVSMLTSEEARASPPTASATVLATVRINTLEVEVSLAAPSSVAVGEQFDVVATLRNVGSTKIMGAKATIHLPTLATGTAFILRGQEDKNAGAIVPGKDKEAKWKLVAEAAGNYVILVTASGTEEVSGDLLDAQDTRIVEVMEGPGGGPGKSDVRNFASSIWDALRHFAAVRLGR